MKDMIYKSERITEILFSGDFEDYKFEIVSYGTHPCAYVYLPEDHPYAELEYDDIPISCHGGLTYKEGLRIGWDYAHLGDFTSFDYRSLSQINKKWETQEIYEDVKDVIIQLIKANNKDQWIVV